MMATLWSDEVRLLILTQFRVLRLCSERLVGSWCKPCDSWCVCWMALMSEMLVVKHICKKDFDHIHSRCDHTLKRNLKPGSRSHFWSLTAWWAVSVFPSLSSDSEEPVNEIWVETMLLFLLSWKRDSHPESLLCLPVGSRGSLPTGVAVRWGVQRIVGKVQLWAASCLRNELCPCDTLPGILPSEGCMRNLPRLDAIFAIFPLPFPTVVVISLYAVFKATRLHRNSDMSKKN